MGGEIRINSIVGKGSVFTFDIRSGLPEIGSEESGIAEETEITSLSKSDKPDCSGKVFLLVEDNDINQFIAINMLEQSGAAIETASNGLEGVEMFKSSPEKYSIIFMDIQMPVMDGYEATRQIRSSGLKRSKKIPIIAMTANVFKEDVEQAKEAGMNYHISKPLQQDVIDKAIKRFIKPKKD
jgi:CheY-like chemotaxis protein